MTEHDLPIGAFLAGELESSTARVVDEHLLSCDRCWLAVQEDRAGRAIAGALREPADPGLVDRIRLAVQLAPPPRRTRVTAAPRARRLGRGLVRGGAFAAAIAVVLAVLTLLSVWPQQHTPRDFAALTRLVALADRLPAARGQSSVPVRVGATRTVREGDQRMTVRTFTFHGFTALVATSARHFAMPTDAHAPDGRAMPWAVTRGAVTVYCPHPTVLLVGPERASELAALAGALH